MLGLTFVGGQVYEFTTFYHEGLTLSTNLFGTTFYVLTGFHGVHVTVGILMLLSLVGMSWRGSLPDEPAFPVEMVGLYWHFVDIVWIVIFTVVYLIPTGARRVTGAHGRTTDSRKSSTRGSPTPRGQRAREHPSAKEYIRIGHHPRRVLTALEVWRATTSTSPARDADRRRCSSCAFVKFVMVVALVHAPEVRRRPVLAVLRDGRDRARSRSTWSCC